MTTAEIIRLREEAISSRWGAWLAQQEGDHDTAARRLARAEACELLAHKDTHDKENTP
jgi:hypothetical protein